MDSGSKELNQEKDASSVKTVQPTKATSKRECFTDTESCRISGSLMKGNSTLGKFQERESSSTKTKIFFREF
jgi:hypothetical protein